MPECDLAYSGETPASLIMDLQGFPVVCKLEEATMGKSVAGPDMRDCLSYILEMDKQGGWFTTILLLPGGSRVAPRVTFNLLSVPTQGGYPEAPGIMTVYAGFPSKEHSTFSGAFYRAIVEHDKQLSGVPLLGPD